MEIAYSVQSDISLDPSEKTGPKVLCAVHNNWLVLGVGSSIQIFDTSSASGCAFNSATFNCILGENSKTTTGEGEADNKVIAIGFLPSSDVFMAVLSSGEVVFASATTRLTHREKLFPPMESCSMSIVDTFDDVYSACILDPANSALFLVSVQNFEAVTFNNEDSFRQHFSTATESVQTISAKGHFLANTAHSFVIFPKHKGHRLSNVSIHPEDFDEPSEMFTYREDFRMVKTIGCFIVALTDTGKFVFFDQNLFAIKVLPLFEAEQKEGKMEVIDFEFLNVDSFCQYADDVKVLLKVNTEEGVQFKIRQLNKNEDQFSEVCSEHAVLIPFSTPGEDNNIAYVDASQAENPTIVIHFVCEAQPIDRLNKLLDAKRFDEALKFAKSYQLSIDLVYTAIVSHCQEQLQTVDDGEEKAELFSEMMRNLKLLSDNNQAADLCIAALPFLNRYEQIKALLNLAKGMQVTDEDTIAEIARFRFELASYRMVFGAEDALFSRHSEWQHFLSSDTHKEFFDRFCADGKVTEARILFARYVQISQKLLANQEQIGQLLATFVQIIKANPARCTPVSEFMEADLIRVLLYSGQNIKDICVLICDFLIDIARELEQLEPKGFPQNALHFSLTFNRAIETLKKECNTSDQYVGFLFIIKQMEEEEDSQNAPSAIASLNTLIRNLTQLVKIHTKYQCPMSYAEYIKHDINSICCWILDRVRAAPSVREHIERYVFPYIEEHGLDRNRMLHTYIKNLANASHSASGFSAQRSNTWELLCLQITEQITDANMRCRAIIEIASGTVPPWNQQLSSVVDAVLGQSEKIDPELITKLRKQCLYADIGEIFIKYQIQLEIRSRILNKRTLRTLLEFIFKNSDKEMVVKLQDVFKMNEIYENMLGKRLLSVADCYFAYALVLVQQQHPSQTTPMDDDWQQMKPLLNLFQSIKSREETEAVASKLVTQLKISLQPTTCPKIVSQRPHLLACLLAIVVRFLPNTAANQALITQARSLQVLQNAHQIVASFELFRNRPAQLQHLAQFIETTSEKHIIGVVTFGRLLGLPVKDSCATLMDAQHNSGFPEAMLKTLSFLLSNENHPQKEHLQIALDACSAVFWKFTKLVEQQESKSSDDKTEFFKLAIKRLKATLPKLVAWAVALEEIEFAEKFHQANRYISLFSLIFETIENSVVTAKTSTESASSETEVLVSSNNKPISSGKDDQENNFFTGRVRLGAMFPQQEGRLFDPTPVVNAVAQVASSIFEPPMEGAEQQSTFNEQMRGSWNRLFILLSRSHVFFEIQARQFANTLPCFNSNEKLTTPALVSVDKQAVQLCQRIFSVPIADFQLAAHLLCSLPINEMNQSLQDLRRWAQSKKNVRYTLNLIRTSLFVLSMTCKEITMFRQVVNWFNATQWQKRFFKQGISLDPSQFKRLAELVPEFAKVLLSSAFLRDYCTEAKESKLNPAAVLLGYAIELCKYSCCLVNDPQRHGACIEEAKAALQMTNRDEATVHLLHQTIAELCPYNYEAIQLLLGTLRGLLAAGGGCLREDHPSFQRIMDSVMLMDFLKIYTRQGSITTSEIRWYKHFINPKYYEMSMLTKSGHSATFDDTIAGAAAMGDVSTMMVEQLPLPPQHPQAAAHFLQEQVSLLPKWSKQRLPFHMLLLEEKEAVDKYQAHCVKNEISIYNISQWISLIECTKVIFRQSRTQMLVGCISNHVQEVVKFKREVNDAELKQIKRLLLDALNRLHTLKALASRFQRIALGRTKLSLIELCCQVIEKWLENEAELPPRSVEREQYEQSLATFRQLLDNLNTEHLLDSNGLLDGDTATLTQKPAELINHLLSSSHKIDWSDAACVAKHFRIIDQIAAIHHVDLEEIFTELIERWIPGNEQMSSAEGGGGAATLTHVNADHDSTIDFLGGGSSGNAQVFAGGHVDDSDFMVPVFYDEPQTTRIIMLLRRIGNPLEKIVEISRKSHIDVSILPGGHLTKIRVASIIFRFLDDQQMQQLFQMNLSEFCSNLINLLNQRLYSICRIEIPSTELEDTRKMMELVRSILSPHSIYRLTPEMGHLIVCLVVDNGLRDLKLLNEAAKCLLQLRLPHHLMDLLKYVRSIPSPDFASVRHFAAYFGQTFENIFIKLESDDNGRELLSLVHFLIGCPVEGEGQFIRAQTLLLTAAQQPKAAALVAIADNAVADIPEDRQKAQQR